MIRPITKLSTKLSIAYGLLFALVLSFSGFFVYTSVERVISETVDSSLDSISDLIRQIVETNMENKRGETRKDLIVAQHYLGTDIGIDENTVTYITFNPVNEQRGEITLPTLTVNGIPVGNEHWIVDQIHINTQGTVSLYQLSQEGFVCISTSERTGENYQGIGWLIPKDSPLYTLMMREQTWFGRDYDYIAKQWLFTGYKLIYLEGRVIGAIHVAQQQTQMENLRKDILSIPVGSSGFPYIIDYVGKVVVHPSLEGKYLLHHDFMLDLVFKRNGRIRYTRIDEITGDLVEYIAYFKYIPEMNWIVIVGSTVQDFYGGLYLVRVMMIAVFGTAILTTQILSLLLGRKITKPITIITRKIKEISEGEANLSQTLDVRSSDEVGKLSEYFNNFVKKLKNISTLERHGVEVMLRDTQMNALQAQINPHFLYNTLETIRFMISMNDKRSMDMVKLLAQLFRVSIGKGEKYVTLRSELEHVNLYLELQKIRYSNRFSVEIAINEDLMDLYTIKFLLQPLVENSIYHGLEEIEGGGIIRISALRKKERLIVSVYDNGAGIPPQKRDTILAHLKNEDRTGSVGLQNVHDRIHLHFGDDYGLTIESAEGMGTTVTLSLPWLTLKPKSTYISENRRPVFIY